MNMKKIYSSILLTATVMLPLTAHAVTADDVVCVKCVNNSDIALGTITSNRIKPHAITTGRIKPGAVSTTQLRDGAVTDEKLSLTLLATITQLQADMLALQTTVSDQQATIDAQQAILTYFR